MKILKWPLILIGVVLAVAGMLVLYVLYGDLNRHQSLFQDVVSEAIGLEVRVDGDFDVDIGERSTLAVGNAHITNASWEQDGRIVTVGRLGIVLDTATLYEPPIVIEELLIEDLDVQLLNHPERGGNWVPATVEPGQSETEPEAAPVDLRINAFTFKNAALVVDGRSTEMTGELTGDLALSIGDVLSVALVLNAEALQLMLPEAPEEEEPSTEIFTEESIDNAFLGGLELDITANVASLRVGETELADLDVTLGLVDRKLETKVRSLRAYDGDIAGELSLTATGSGIDARASLMLDSLRFGEVWSEEAGPDSLPGLSGELSFAGSGSSVQGIMNGSSGELAFRQSAGRMKNFAVAGLFGDVVIEVLRTLNPLRDEEPYTSFDCGVYAVSISDGEATIDDFRVQTDKIMLVGNGGAKFADESIDVTMRSKPREGFGISLGGVANSFVKLGGTLGQPAIQLDAAASATTTGAAVATGGLSLLARGLFDRLSAANDICESQDID